MSIIEDNRTFANEMQSICGTIEQHLSNINDGTIMATIKLLQGHIDEFVAYDKLADRGNICEEISLLELFNNAFSSKVRQIPKDRRSIFEVYDEGERVANEYNVIEKYKVKNCFSSFGLLPEILMDNAIKYSISGMPIKIDIHQDIYRKTIILSNIGPCLEEGEEETIFSLDENYRGKNANKTGIPGHGMGLKLASLIISSHKWRDASISVNRQESEKDQIINEIPYNWFCIEISIKEPDTSNIPDQNMVCNAIGEYLQHEYSRTNPLLEKHAIELYEEVFCRKECYKIVDICQLRKSVYGLYQLVMDHIVKSIDVIWDSSEFDLKLPNVQKRFDNQLLSLIDRAAKFKNSEIEIIRDNRGSFGLAPMFSSVYIFYYLLSEYVSGFSSGELLVRFSVPDKFQGASMELVAPEGDDFSHIPNKNWDIMCRIMKKHNICIDRSGETLSIIRRNAYESL